MQRQKMNWAGVNKNKTLIAVNFKRNVSGTTRLTGRFVKRKLSSNLIAQQKRIAPSLACV